MQNWTQTVSEKKIEPRRPQHPIHFSFEKQALTQINFLTFGQCASIALWYHSLILLLTPHSLRKINSKKSLFFGPISTNSKVENQGINVDEYNKKTSYHSVANDFHMWASLVPDHIIPLQRHPYYEGMYLEIKKNEKSFSKRIDIMNI